MRLETPPELEEFRREVREFIEKNAPGVKTRTGVRAPEPEQMPAIRAWTAALYEAGFLGINWPAEYGGRPGAHPMESFIVAEEIARARTWAPIGAAALASAAIIEFGTPEQQKHFLPRIRSCEDVWCQLFSEPGAGSDLASLQTRAVRDGDEYVVTGQKVWTSGAQYSDIGEIIVRTDADQPKHKGLTGFVVDMHAPGVEVRPLRQMTGGASFNEVFFTDVRVPDDHRLGDVNQGWTVALTTLMNERAAIGAGGAGGSSMVSTSRLVELLRHYASASDPILRQQLVDLHVK